MPKQGSHTTGTTKKIGSCTVPNIITGKISRPKPYFIMVAYGGHGGDEMLKAAKFKKKRLLLKYPNAVIPEPYVFKSLSEFKSIWTNVADTLCSTNKSGQLTYDLQEMHIFAHSNSDRISISKGQHITAEVVKSLEILNWNPVSGYLVLHSCRAARYEGDNIDKRSGFDCIAREFSINQKTSVIGQMVYASFNYAPEPSDFKTRSAINDYIAISVMGKDELVLWGYRSGKAVTKRYSNDKEYLLLQDGQIWPCRKFKSGLECERIVMSNSYNDDDLNFI